jgi:hypothetical protein
MQIYFTSTKIGDPFYNSRLFNTRFSDKKYYYGIEYGSNAGALEDILIYDTLGRNIPVDVRSIDNLIDALHRVKTFIGIAEQHDTLSTTLDNIADPEQKVGL